ncbi:peptidase M15 [Bacillus sp. AFS076308]|uniref:M15 family metallopeptidase n=1 Tax=unclassified Bacillus (in: firmicutes) TaxID=185979 RepID=UPI000BF57541|nr:MULTISPECIES: M15 family metallopeptidase [unclassified Bacillus (in: firmicutes)]PFO04981.1 peptidase M15 [Bacillus sp. AFS076308]PGV48359.1 peptidase M15 [Bacillus sp. AFS037270]
MTKLPLIMVFMMVIGSPLAGCSLKQNFVENQPIAPSKNGLNTKTLNNEKSVAVVANPSAIPVLVNKYHKLPDSYKPSDLVDPDIPFIFKEKVEKRKMRSSAARAIEKLFAGAKQAGVSLLGVSAYRSHAAQTALFNHYVSIDGVKAAKTYSAVPGTSEHETGLAIDVTGGDGKCAAEDCFAGTTAAKWLEKHAAEYGFIIRYPKGKDDITGYQYEPWHLRYVGKTVAQEITSQKITLEEYQETIQVNK